MQRFEHRFALIALLILTNSGGAHAQGAEPYDPTANVSTQSPSAEQETPATANEAEGAEVGTEPAVVLDPARPPAKGLGVLWGVVTDTALHEPLIEAAVLVNGTNIQVLTDLYGRYRLELPPGTYTLRFLYELHRPARLEKVVVRRARVYRHDMVLEPEEGAEDTIEVQAEVEQSTLEGQMLARQRTTTVADSVGRTEIAKSADTNAAQAAQRVVGASIEGGRFVYVRGLGERYTNGLLNGAPLPSPEPDRAAVPLDLFPSQVLESVSINKTFTPDMPADFAGGSVNVQTREIPEKPLFNASASAGFDTATTFRDRPAQRGSRTDWLGFDSGLRSLPDAVPDDSKVANNATRPDGTRVTPEELTGVGRAMNTYMTPVQSFTMPNHGLSVVAGNGWQTARSSRLGAIASLNYGRSYDHREGIERTFVAGSDGEPVPFVDYRRTSGLDKVRWGAMGSLTYELSECNQVKLLGLHSQLSDNEAQSYEGYNRYRSADVRNDRLIFTSRALDFVGLSGRHEFDVLNRGVFDWNASLSSARRNEPDTRDVVYQWNSTRDAWSYTDSSNSGRHFYATQSETARGGGLNWTQPLERSDEGTNVKVGAAAVQKSREFRARRFAFRKIPGRTSADPAFFCEGRAFDPTCSDRVFVRSNIGTLIRIEEGTRATDAYDAALDVFAGYAMGELALARNLRLVGGGRLEVTRQTVEPVDQLLSGEAVSGARLSDSSILPAASLVFSATQKSKLRVAASRTLARPQLRELAPFAFSNYFGGREETGNPDLTLTHITNADVRFEYFPTLGEVLALTVFFKYLEDPIERVLIPSGGEQGIMTFRNSPNATLIGVELEGRKNLEFLDEALREFTLIANVTLSRSRVGVEQTGADQSGRGFMTSVSRPMMLHAPWVLNLALDYTHQKVGFGARILYNVAGPRIADVGTEGIADEYIQPRHGLDLALTQQLGENVQAKLTVEDLLNSDTVVTLGRGRSGEVASRTSEGTVITLAASYAY